MKRRDLLESLQLGKSPLLAGDLDDALYIHMY